MLELVLWVLVTTLAILVLTGVLSGTLLAWFVVGSFAFIILIAIIQIAAKL